MKTIKKKKISKKIPLKKTLKKKAIVKRLGTPKEKKLIKIFSENFGKTGGSKTIQEMMMEAGYAKSTAMQQSVIIGRIKDSKEYQDHLKWLNRHKEMIMNRMDENIDKADYGELSRTLARIENIILLSQGKPTSNLNILSDKGKQELDDLFKDNS